jgi:hypothetical protein
VNGKYFEQINDKTDVLDVHPQHLLDEISSSDDEETYLPTK